MFNSLFVDGKIQKRILPGSDTKSTISQSECYSYKLSDQNNFELDNTNYVSETKEEIYDKWTNITGDLPDSSMSCAESVTHYGSIADLKDLDTNQIRYFENYKFKDPSDISNNLEIAKFKDKIVQEINSNSMVLICGATGCGKSTQIPQFILDDSMARKKYCNIIVTQPRRIAAISVSKQVNKERGWKNGLLVGYQVGRKKDFDPNNTKILYCTTGVLLQKIIQAKHLSDYTHIILDEIHERTLEMDFLLLIIKKCLKTNLSTRIILMSATAEMDKISNYFNEFYGYPQNRYIGIETVNICRTRNHQINVHYLDELYGLIPSAQKMVFNKPTIDDSGYDTAIALVKGFYNLEQDDNPKSVLIFLPGIFEIEELYQRLKHLIVSENYKWILIPLHSSITSEEQIRVFEKPLLNYRKIILSTNIAESSITVPDVSYVIDFCLMKQLKNEMKSNYSMLILTWASKSNCEQRAGRVGRVSDGRVYRLVPKSLYNDTFDSNELPEMRRCSLSQVVLMSKILDMGTPKYLLGNALDPPSLRNIHLTILILKQVGALLPTLNGVISSEDGDITYLGRVMAHLPLNPPMSKLIYFGYIFNILNDAIIMACGLSVKNLFSQPFNKRLEAYTQKLTWANHSCSDPIAFIGPYKSWLENKPQFDRNRHLEKMWANKNYIQLSAIHELYDLIDDVTHRLRKQFNIVVNLGEMKWESEEERAMACKVILAGAFYPNYFVRGFCNSYMDEHEVLKILNKHDPNRTVYFTGFPYDQPKELYKEAIESLFPVDYVGKPTAYFDTSNKVYIEFPSSNTNIVLSSSNKNDEDKQLIPGNISFGVYIAIKMYQLKTDFKIPLLKSSDAIKRVEQISKQMTQKTLNTSQEILPVQKSILEEIEANVKIIDITVSYFKSIDHFWVQLYGDIYKQKLVDIWDIVKAKINLISISQNNLKIGDIYIVIYMTEEYRAKLIHILPGHQDKYEFLLIDFGEIVEVPIENIFDILNKHDKNKIYSVPSLAFQCTIAKIRPTIHEKLESKWSENAKKIFLNYGYYPNKLSGTIYSIVNGVVSFEDLICKDGENIISIPKDLIKYKLACQSEDTFASKMDHEKRYLKEKSSDFLLSKPSILDFYLKSPTKAESNTMHSLKGPYSPLEMAVQGMNRHSSSASIKIESQSVNSVLLDTNPNDYHDRLFVAGNVCLNENEKLTLWDSTMMPNIPGLPAIICLMFSPCVEIRYNPSYTKMIGAICGLGYDPETSRPLFGENDIEVVFDTVMDHNILNTINIVRMLLNKCVNPVDELGPGDIFQIQHQLQVSLLEIFSMPTKFKAPEMLSSQYMWGSIPESRLQSPYKENAPVNHPMAGSDVYKLLWGVSLSSKMSNAECSELFNKLSKIKRLENEFKYLNLTNKSSLEELRCPLCQLSFTNGTSMQKHLMNYQHIERYAFAKHELQLYYAGPFDDINNL